MNKIVVGVLGTVAAGVGLLAVVAARHMPTYPKNTFVGDVAIGGLNEDEAARAIRIWWEEHKSTPVKLEVKSPAVDLGSRTAGSIGMTIADKDSLDGLPQEDLASEISDTIGNSQPDKKSFPLKFKWVPMDLTGLAKDFQKHVPPPAPAKVIYQDGGILKRHEVGTVELDLDSVPTAVAKAVADGSYVADISVKEAPKRIPDADLDEIKDIVSQFSTHFPASNRPRCSNIRLASSKLRGVVLMPGEVLSFNGTVGRRTIKGGFQLAGVYKNGKHDVGVGGGICQVSTTLYNACLLADLKIRQRSNHSLPVAYVPLGRDATVDYGDLDLIVENTYSTPIAVDSHYEPGRLTFRILGKKDPGLNVRITQSDAKSWSETVDKVLDRHLRPGAMRVVEPGSRGHAVTTYRLVYHDGKLTRRDYLGRSTYGGQTRVVAYNPAAPKPVVPTTPGPVVPAPNQPTTVPTPGTPIQH